MKEQLNRFYSKQGSLRLPEIIFDIKQGKNNNNICIIYDKNSSKATEIEIPSTTIFVERLDNKDLIFVDHNGFNYELLVYRLMSGKKNEKKGYFLNQKIKETIEGFKIKYEYITPLNGPIGQKVRGNPIFYVLFFIKVISRNRFFCISSYGCKLYALNEKKEYELVLLEQYEQIDFICEIDTNKFIFGLNLVTQEGYGDMTNITFNYNLKLNIIELKTIDWINSILNQGKSNKEKNKDILDISNNQLTNNDKDDDSLDNLDVLQFRKKLKYSFLFENMFEYKDYSPYIPNFGINFSDFVTLKNKFFIIMIGEKIFIFNMETGKEIKRFKIIHEAENYNPDIKKWDCEENDQFIMIVNNNVILFKLNEEDSSEISLNILSYAYFPKLLFEVCENDIIAKDLKKANDQKNRFYSYKWDKNPPFEKETNEIIIY